MLDVDLHLYLKCHYSTGVFQSFASKKQLPGLSAFETLVENVLTLFPLKLSESHVDFLIISEGIKVIRFSDDFKGNRNSLIHLNSFNIRMEI